MSRRPTRRGRDAGRGKPWWLVAAGVLAVVIGVFGFSSSRLGSQEAAAELAPDITLTTLQGDYRLSEQRGEVVVLYFSFVG